MKLDEMLAMLEKVKFTQANLVGATESVRGDNHDETDTALVAAIKEAINAGGVGPRDLTLLSYFRAVLGVATFNALGSARNVLKAVADDPERGEKLKEVLIKAMSSELTEAHKAITKQFDLEMISFMWALFQQGILHGIFLGWRGHEIALINEAEPFEETPKEEVASEPLS